MTSEVQRVDDGGSAEFAPGVRTGPLLGCVAGATLGGAILGAATNAITGRVAAGYFRALLGWWDIQDVWRAAIAEGVFAGIMTGFFGALLFVVIVGLTTRCRVGFVPMAKALLLAAGAAVVGWVLGGVVGIGIALISPERFERLFFVPEGRSLEFEPTAFGWAGGSIAGLSLGALAGAVVGAVRIRARWKSAQEAR